MAGALHGAKWIPPKWDDVCPSQSPPFANHPLLLAPYQYQDVENEAWGRDYAIRLGIKLASVDHTSIPDIPNNDVPVDPPAP